MLTYEDCAELIEKELRKRRRKWTLGILRWIDWEDIAQIIRAHIAKKWHLWDQTRKLEPWIQRIASNQIYNQFRNLYTSHARPCVQCKFSLGDDACSETPSNLQCNECPLYEKWSKTKKYGYHAKMPLELENHAQEVNNKIDDTINFQETMHRVMVELEKHMTEKRFESFKALFIDNIPENELAAILKLRGRDGISQKKLIAAHKDSISKEAKRIIAESDIAEYWP